MKNLILVFFIIISGCENREKNSIQKIEQSNVSDKDIYEIVNLILRSKSETENRDGIKPCEYIVDIDLGERFNKIDSLTILSNDTIFTKEDLKFIREQIQNRKGFKFSNPSINFKKVISADTLQKILVEYSRDREKDYWKIYKNKFDESGYYKIGLPLFSKDKKTVYIKFESNYFGISSSGETMVFRKVNNEWTRLNVGSAWM